MPLFGNHLRNQLGLKSTAEISVELYKKYPGEKVIGYYIGTTPELIVKDLDLVRQILTADFPHFYERGLGRNPDLEWLFLNLFHAEGDQWKLLRQRLTPAFTTAKLKAMFPLIIRCAERLQEMVSDITKQEKYCDAREVMARFTTEFIGACGFGIEMDSLNTKRSQFRELGKLIFTRTLRNRILMPIWEIFPEVRNFLDVNGTEIAESIMTILQQIREQRDYKPIGRNDFIDILLELETKGKIAGESIEKVDNNGTPAPAEMEMDLKCQAAQVFIFFAAGFETSSSATSFALHMLAFHPEIQKRVQKEIDDVLLKHNNALCYEAISEMTLLDMTFKEAMRMFPSLGCLNRVCTRKYKIPELDITLDPGVKILIPVQAIHMDEKYYDNPTEFRPERFAPAAVKERHNFAYLPFGDGPRACIGEKVIGYYIGTTPQLIIKDLDLVRQVLVADFPHFYERGLGRNPKLEWLFSNLFHVEGDQWRLIRQRLTPAFTTAKLKAMFPLIIRCAERLQDMVSEISKQEEYYDAREIMARFTTEFIGACGFGIEMDSINTKRSQFRELGKVIFSRSLRSRIILPICQIFPELREFIRIDNTDLEKAMTAIVEQIREKRNYQPIGRNDFIDMLLELEQKGKIVGQSIAKVDSDGTPAKAEMEMDLKCQAAQVFIFFAAGFETSSSATSFALHMLAFHPEIQKRVQKEIDNVLLKHNNALCYEAISEMTLLDMTFKEAMRMFPSLGCLNRVCTRKYKIPELGITLDPGVKILIPVQAIHMDEKYYDNPTEFRPERFAPDAVKERHNFAYLPFGDGPRGCIAFYFYATKNHNYWEKRNVKHDPPMPLFGNHLRNYLGLKSTTEISLQLYKKYPGEKIVGYYIGTTPELMIKDLDLVRQVLVADFPHFYQRGLGRNPKLEWLFSNLFHAEGDQWRLIRQRLTPAFTTAKLKAMFPLIIRCAEKLQDMVSEISKQEEHYDAREIMARFTTEFIGACGFGIEMDSINTKRSQFRELGKVMFSRSLRSRIIFSICQIFPEARKFLRIDNTDLEKAMTAIVEQIREQRNYRPIGRNDFIDMLLELEQKGKIVGQSIEKVDSDGTAATAEMEMDLKCQTAQVFIFFAAGFETSSSATSFALHMLAFHPEIQKRIQKEVDDVLLKHNNALCYEAISEMTLLDMTFKEAMRMFPSLGCLNRVCTRKYKIPELDITLDPGVKILIPVQAIHMDEKYYDNPTEFRPERFTPDAVKERHNFAYLPFGDGPRGCIGARLGHMQSLAGLAAILQKFTVEPAENTVREITVKHTSNVVQSVEGGLPLRFTPRD
ncbi:cytochrome p450 domain-containing protein [Phthorimaea operculella]|nr:cytochrome p450 domain-containing protein [Phthorimaea operculella]